MTSSPDIKGFYMKTIGFLLVIVLLMLSAGLLCSAAAESPSDTAVPSGTAGVSPAPAIPPGMADPGGVPPADLAPGQTIWIPAMPLFFIQNEGQSRNDTLFEMISDGGPIRYTKDGSELRLIRYDGDGVSYASVGFRFVNAGSSPDVVGTDQLMTRANFIQGTDPSGWTTAVRTYRAIRYTGLYPGIDLLYEGTDEGIKSTYFVAPDAQPENIVLEYYGITGLRLSPEGILLIDTDAGLLTQSAPYCYQEIGNTRVEVTGAFTLLGENRVGFSIPDYDPERELIIDPVMKYGLYLRGVGMANAYGVAVDQFRNAYVAGKSFPAPYSVIEGAVGANNGGTDVIVVKINEDGTIPIFITYIGGSGDDGPNGIAVDDEGYPYLVGTTNSPDFPVTGPIQSSLAGMNDAFVSKLDRSGSSLVYSTYVGGTGDDYGNAIAIDGQKNAYITGSTSSDPFPVISRYQRTSLTGVNDAYAVKINREGTELVYSVYIGGSVFNTGYGIAVDPAGNCYVTGETFSSNFPVVNAYDSTYGGSGDTFLTKVSPIGDSFVYSTFLGGTSRDMGKAVAVDSSGSVHVTGYTQSRNFPLVSPYQGTFQGIIDVFYTRFTPSGTALEYSTLIGGSGWDEARGISVDPAGSVYIAGLTNSRNMPVVGGYQPAYGGGDYDAFVAKFIPGQSVPAYLTYLGGVDLDQANAIAPDGLGGAYIVGQTRSMNFPTVDPYPNIFSPRGQGGFIAALLDYPEPPRIPTADFDANTTAGLAPLPVGFRDLSTGYPTGWYWEFGDGTTSTARNPLHVYSSPGIYTVNLTASNALGSTMKSRPGYITVTTIPLPPVANFTADPTSGTSPLAVHFTDTSENNPTGWLWEYDGGRGWTIFNTTQNPAYTFSEGTYTIRLTATNDAGSNTLTRTGYITVAPPCPVPIANFTAIPDEGTVPLTVQFTDTSLNNPTSWFWEFGNGVTNTTQNPQYTYTVPWTYTVNLTVTNDCG
jgi:PKD repeat protein